MKILLTSVGDTDPIRNYRDGSLLHIARNHRPDKIIVISSERMIEKIEDIKIAVTSIPNYSPEFEVSDKILSNDDVSDFDKMFDEICRFIEQYLDVKSGHTYLLNISSGTPQIKNAFFLYNRLQHSSSIQAVMVKTPERGSNAGVGHDINEDIQVLIETNLDNDGSENRTSFDQGPHVTEALLKQTIRAFIEKYDYQAALEVLKKHSAMEGASEIIKELEEITESWRLQRIPQRLNNRKGLDDEQKKILHAYLVIQLQKEKGNVGESLIRIKALSEYLFREYSRSRYGLEVGEMEERKEEQGKFATLFDYRNFLRGKKEFDFIHYFDAAFAVNESRNTISHSIDEITANQIERLGEALKWLKKVLISKKYYRIDSKFFEFYQQMNQLLLEKLQ